MHANWCFPGTTMKKIQPISSKSAVAASPACVAILLPAMTDHVAPTVTEVRFAYTIAGILACKQWDWRNILGIDRQVDNPNIASSYRKLNMLIHPDRRTKLGIELAGGIDKSNRALHVAQEAYKDAVRWSVEKTLHLLYHRLRLRRRARRARAPLLPSRGL